MGTREEIEWKAAHCVLENGRDQRIFDETIADVLSIIDEHLGECVMEYANENDFAMMLCIGTEDGLTEEPLVIGPGDRIAIYRLPKEE